LLTLEIAMPIYRLQRRLSHADVDFLGELKVPALLGLLEQAAVEASTAAGFDAARYTREGRIWIIRRTRLQRLVPVGGGDTVEVETRVADFRRARSLRRYTVRRHSEVVAEATTDWVYCDLQTGRPVRVPEALQSAFMGGAATEALPRAESLPAGAPGVPAEFTLTVQPSHLDHVGHVNNAVYASCYGGLCQVGLGVTPSMLRLPWRQAYGVAAHLEDHRARLSTGGT
jgi:acyl-CoA thioester hydrolase